ncbi:MAG: hydrogenase 3 maturation endopeptidase HyCI [Elusimicrobiota bacterium]
MNEVRSFLRPWAGRRVLILGVGSPLKGDDQAGPELVRRLQGKTRAHLLDCGGMPENHGRAVLALKPELILLVDAAEFGGGPGEVRLLEERDIGSSGLGTHGLSLRVFLSYLRSEISFQAALLGIQPKSMEFDEPLSPEVEAAVQELEKVLREELPASGSASG